MKHHAHTFQLWRVIARRVCTHCGLVELRNDRSRRAAAEPCKWWDE